MSQMGFDPGTSIYLALQVIALPTELMEISNTTVPITLDMGAFLLHHYTQPKLCTKAFPAMYIQKFGLCFENR